MGQNIIICLDGTNNQFGDVNTNVVRLIRVPHRDTRKQRIYYGPGVATWIGKKSPKASGLLSAQDVESAGGLFLSHGDVGA